MTTMRAVLLNRLWHATSADRWAAIRQSGAILPDPPIPDSARWHTSAGAVDFPFVRSLGAVSLFDFRAFEATTYDARYPVSRWRNFIFPNDDGRYAVWLAIDWVALGPQFISASALMEQLSAEGAQRRPVVPMLEAAHRGPLGIEHICAAWQCQAGPDGQPTWHQLLLSEVRS